MRVAIIVDKFGWAYETIAKYIADGQPNDRKKYEVVLIAGHNHSPKNALSLLEGFDVVHFLDWHFMSFWKYRIDNAVASIHSWRNRDGIDWVKNYASAITVVNHEMMHEFPNAEYIPNGIDVKRFKPNKKRVLGFAGRPDEYKGFYIVKRVCDELDIQLVVASDMKLTYETMPSFYQNVDAIITPSIEEGFNMPMLEALASGIHVFTPMIGVANKLNYLPQVTIIERNEFSIRDRLKAFFFPEKEMFDAGFDWDKVVKKYWEIYLSIKK